MGVLKIYWRVIGCQNYQKVRKFVWFCKNHDFQVAVSQKKSYWKVGSRLYVKCAWCCSQKHIIECLSSIICDFIGCWKWDRLQKVGNCELKTHFWNPISSELRFGIHVSYINLKIWAEIVPEILKSNNLKIPQWSPGPSKFVVSRNFQK